MFKTRLLSGIVLVLLALLFIIHGGYLLLTVLGIISLIGLFELYVYSVLRKVHRVSSDMWLPLYII